MRALLRRVPRRAPEADGRGQVRAPLRGRLAPGRLGRPLARGARGGQVPVSGAAAGPAAVAGFGRHRLGDRRRRVRPRRAADAAGLGARDPRPVHARRRAVLLQAVGAARSASARVGRSTDAPGTSCRPASRARCSARHAEPAPSCAGRRGRGESSQGDLRARKYPAKRRNSARSRAHRAGESFEIRCRPVRFEASGIDFVQTCEPFQLRRRRRAPPAFDPAQRSARHPEARGDLAALESEIPPRVAQPRPERRHALAPDRQRRLPRFPA